MPAPQQLLDRARQVGAGAAVDVPSPCISVCRMDPRTQLCEGCCRTLEEIAAWSRMDDEEKRAVWQAIAERARKQAVIPAKAEIQPAESTGSPPARG